MAWGYWSATSVDRGRSPRRNTQCNVMPINTVPQSEPPVPTCYSPCRSSRCSSPSCHATQVIYIKLMTNKSNQKTQFDSFDHCFDNIC